MLINLLYCLNLNSNYLKIVNAIRLIPENIDSKLRRSNDFKTINGFYP